MKNFVGIILITFLLLSCDKSENAPISDGKKYPVEFVTKLLFNQNHMVYDLSGKAYNLSSKLDTINVSESSFNDTVYYRYFIYDFEDNPVKQGSVIGNVIKDSLPIGSYNIAIIGSKIKIYLIPNMLWV